MLAWRGSAVCDDFGCRGFRAQGFKVLQEWGPLIYPKPLIRTPKTDAQPEKRASAGQEILEIRLASGRSATGAHVWLRACWDFAEGAK